MKKIFSLLILLSLTILNAHSKMDTIKNWQLYKDKIIILKSNTSETITKTCLINLKEKFKQLSINVFQDTGREAKGIVIQVIIKNHIMKRYSCFCKQNESFIINYEDIINLLKKNINKEITLKYIDETDIKGFEIGKIKII